MQGVCEVSVYVYCTKLLSRSTEKYSSNKNKGHSILLRENPNLSSKINGVAVKGEKAKGTLIENSTYKMKQN